MLILKKKTISRHRRNWNGEEVEQSDFAKHCNVINKDSHFQSGRMCNMP